MLGAERILDGRQGHSLGNRSISTSLTRSLRLQEQAKDMNDSTSGRRIRFAAADLWSGMDGPLPPR